MRDLAALGLLSFAILAACATAPRGVHLTRHADVVDVTLDGQPFATVHCAAEPRPFVFPLLGPGGTPMTRSWPMAEADGEEHDHPHHQSLWFAHGDVDGFDFWAGKARGERIALDGEPQLDGGKVRCRYHWLAEGNVLATEDRVLAFGGSDAARTVDIDVTLRPAARPLVLGDTKEGTFALRVHPALRVDGKIATGTLHDSEGRSGKEVWGQRARWIDDVGTVAGRAVGVAMFDHPDNPSHPVWWHARTYGLLAANPFGVHDFAKQPAGTGTVTVPLGGALRCRYRVLLHDGDHDAARIDAAYRAWAGR